MNVIFANPAGLWALLAIPAILAIHLLQRESRRVRTSTLFLLERLSPASAQGRRIERIRNSIPLWLQLLAALLVTWLLVQPRWLRKDSSQTIAVVLDSSVSMDAFRERMTAALRKRLPELARAAARTEWTLLESDPTRPTLYSGLELDALFAAVNVWRPGSGTHDPVPALRVAESLVGRTGAVIFVTDRADPEGTVAKVLAVGTPIDNVGFVGLQVDGTKWTALVRNHGASPQTRQWSLEGGASPASVQTISLAPGELATLSGSLPEGVTRAELVLQGDGFAVDDRLPIVSPRLKPLVVSVSESKKDETFFRRFAESLPAATAGGTSSPDLRLSIQDPQVAIDLNENSIVALSLGATEGKFLGGPIVAGNHPLTENLSWQGLIVRDGPHFEKGAGDEVLLWQGDRPLILLRSFGGREALIVNFDIARSNADRVPAFVVLMNRFAESIRAKKETYERLNVETNQILPIARSEDEVLRVEGCEVAGAVIRAPARPGFLSISKGDALRLEGAAHFADVREADFRDATSGDNTASAIQEAVERNSREDFLTPLWTILLGIVCFGNWAFARNR